MTSIAASEYPTGFTKWIIVITAITCAVLELVDMSIVNVALREISGSIGATTTEIAWVVTAYAISNVIIIPLTSLLSDLFGRRLYFTMSVLLFTFASLMCGLSGSLWSIVFWRFVQGLGGGALLSTSQTIIIGAFPPQKLSIATAIFGMGIIMGPTFGPTVGGYITDNFSWHWIFFVNIPIGAVAALLSWNFITDRAGAQKPKRIDWWGILFLIIAVSSLQYVLEEGTAKDWFESTEITMLAIIAGIGLIAFIYREWNTEEPAVNIRLYRNFNLAIGNVMNFILGMILMGTVFVFPLFAQLSLGWTATQTGAFMIPGALCTALAMPIVGKLLSKGANPKVIILIGVGIVFTFLMMMSFSSPDSTEKNFYLPFVLRGFGMGFMMSPIISLAVKGLSGRDLAQGVSLSNMIRQLGGAVGIALINVYISNRNAINNMNLIGYVSQYTTMGQERVAALTQNFMSAGYYQSDAEMLAYKTLNGMVYKQQAIISYNQAFFLVALGVLGCIPLVLLIRHRKGEVIKAASDH